MNNIVRRYFFVMAAAAAVGLANNYAHAQQQIRIVVENLQPADGFYLTPLWFGMHNGTFDLTNVGGMASAGLELLAEEGDVSGVMGEFAAAQPMGTQSVVFGPGGFPGAPVFDPGETAMSSIVITNPGTNQYFSYASMVIPSNDGFIGNEDPQSIQLFDAAGNFTGPVSFTLSGADIWDAGTEVNDPFGGAAFSANGGMSVSESLLVRLHPGLNDFLGTNTAAGTTIGSALNSGTPLFRISISSVPEPGSLLLLGLASVVCGSFRRRI